MTLPSSCIICNLQCHMLAYYVLITLIVTLSFMYMIKKICHENEIEIPEFNIQRITHVIYNILCTNKKKINIIMKGASILSSCSAIFFAFVFFLRIKNKYINIYIIDLPFLYLSLF